MRVSIIFMALGFCANAFAAENNQQNPVLNTVKFEQSFPGEAVTLVKDGAQCASIVLADATFKSKTGIDYQAAAELVKYVKLATGAELPIKSDLDTVPGTLILVGESKLTQDRKISAADLPMEGFRVATFADGLAIVGRLPDLNVTPESKGTLWGVYDVLERYLGIRLYHPGADGFIVPSSKNLIVAPVQYTDYPRRIKRAGWPPPAPIEYRAAEATWISHSCHTPSNFGIHFKEFPECFELGVDGKHNSGMPCYGNPQTVKLMLQDIENYFKGNKGPWGGWGEPTEKAYYISPPDKGVECHCEYCTKLTDPNAPDIGRTSKLVALFVANMAKEIKKRYPGMTVHFLPYSNYTLPPEGVTFPPNVMATVCLMRGAANSKEPDVAAEHDKMISGWARLTGRPVRVWEYPCYPVEDTALPFQYPHAIQDFQRRHPKDVEGSYLDSGFQPPELGPEGIWKSQAPTFYCWFRLMWNPDFNVDAALDEYVSLMYGPAKEPMGKILSSLTDRWEQIRWQNPPDGHHASPHQVNEETMPRAEALKLRDWLAQARSLAPEGTVHRRRVDYFGQAIEVFLRESDTYHEGGKDLPTLMVLKVGGMPKLDGKLDDTCWKDAVAQSFKMARDANAPDADKATTVQAVWTDQGVTFGFKLFEPEITKIRDACTLHDQDVFGDDCIEMFLDVEGNRSKYYQIVANSRGAIYDGTASGAEWDAPGAKAVAYKDKNFWSLEIFVPYCDFPEKLQVKVGSVWYANFTRSRYVANGMQLQRWSTLKRPSNHDFSAFGKVRFVE